LNALRGEEIARCIHRQSAYVRYGANIGLNPWGEREGRRLAGTVDEGRRDEVS
jgi:hypothetical protein